MTRGATLYRVVLSEHVRPLAVRAKAMLKEAGYATDEHILRSRNEGDALQAEHDVETTPLDVHRGKRIGGSDDLAR